MPNKSIEELWTKNFILICIINFCTFSGFQMFPAALPPYLKTLGASDGMVGWFVAIASVTTLLVRPFSGLALDKFGRGPVFVCGLTIMLLASLAHFSQALLLLFFVRSVHGIGWAISGTACNTIASENIPKTRFGEGMGYFSLFASLALAIAPALALSMIPRDMIITAAVFIGLALLVTLFLKIPRMQKAEQGAGAVAAKSGLYEKNAVIPAILLFLFTSAYGAVLTFVAIFAAEHGIGNIGVYFTVYAVFLLLTRPLVGKILDRRGYGAGILPGAVIVVASLLSLGLAESLPMFIVSAALMGAGQGAGQTSAQTMAVAGVPRNRLGAANGTFFMGFDAGVGFGSVSAGIVAGYIGYGNMYMLFALLPFCAALVFMAASARRRAA